MMKIDYGKIVTNALSALVAAVFVGAAAILWNAAMSIDERINESNRDLLEQQARLQGTQASVVDELARTNEQLRRIEQQIQKILEQTPEARREVEAIFKNRREFEGWAAEEQNRIKSDIDTRQMEYVKQYMQRDK